MQTNVVNYFKRASLQKNLLLLLLLAAAFFSCYLETILGLFNIWINDGDYSYALAIPFVSGFIIWKKKESIANTPIMASWVGCLFLLFFLMISLYGILGSSPSAVRPAIPMVILSLTLFCYGKKIFKILAFPLSLLIFMIPLPTLLQTRLGVPLQAISTKLGEGLLRLLGVSVFVEGNIIDLGIIQLQVVEACSGLRYILPLLALGVIFVYFFEKSRWKQLVLIISTIPIAIFTNAIRISITGFLAQNYGPQVADSFFHGFSGWLIFLAALMMLFVFYTGLRALLPDEPLTRQAKAGPNNRLPQPNSGNNTTPLIISIVLLFSVGIWGHATAKIPPVRVEGGLSNFPLLFNDWKGRPIDIDPEIIRLSGAEDAFNATYMSNAGGMVTLYIGYRGSPFTESENFFHSPNVCLPSLGWKTLAISDHEVFGVPGFDKIVVRKMFIEKMGYRQLVYYWFQTKSRVSSNVNINRLHLTFHALRRDRTHDLFIRPMTPLKPYETAREAGERLDRFVRDLMGTLLNFLSSKQAVSP